MIFLIAKLPFSSVVVPAIGFPSERRLTAIPTIPAFVSPPITVPESVYVSSLLLVFVVVPVVLVHVVVVVVVVVVVFVPVPVPVPVSVLLPPVPMS